MIINLNTRVLRNYIISVAFIISSVVSYLKEKENFKTCIIIWLIILIGWAINFILDNHIKMDNCTQRTLSALNKIEEAVEKTGQKIRNYGVKIYEIYMINN